MKTHSTNYFNTLIEVAEDTKATAGTQPPAKPQRTVAEMQHGILAEHPYRYTSDEILFQVFADRNGLAKSDYKQAREQFFSKGQACFRASPLPKIYGFGVHFDKAGKAALYGMETEAYQKLKADASIKKVKAMKASR